MALSVSRWRDTLDISIRRGLRADASVSVLNRHHGRSAADSAGAAMDVYGNADGDASITANEIAMQHPPWCHFGDDALLPVVDDEPAVTVARQSVAAADGRWGAAHHACVYRRRQEE